MPDFIPEIHWEEGLLLQPHHLQRMQRGLGEKVARYSRLLHPFPYGVLELNLSRADLESNRKVFLNRLRAIMPSGLEVNAPETALLDERFHPLDIAEPFERIGDGHLDIYLGVPRWREGRANTLDGAAGGEVTRSNLAYRVREEQECVDDNNGRHPRPIRFRVTNARLVLGEEKDNPDLEVLHLFRIVRLAGGASQDGGSGAVAGRPAEDPAFVAPSLVLKAAPALYGMTRDLVSQLEAERKQTAQRMSRDNFSFEDTVRGTQFRRILRLRTLSRASGYLASLVEADGVAPFEIYLELKALFGELMSLYPSRGDFDCPAYDHENLYESLFGLSEKIREMLPEIPDRFLRVPFKKEDGVLTADLKEIDLSGKAERFLAIKMRVDLTTLASHVEKRDSFRVLPLSKSRQAIYGIPLKAELGPGGLPVQEDLHYFRLRTDEKADMWDAIKDERKLAVIPGSAPGLEWSAETFAIYIPASTTASRP
jgi:type VI secretion system ImpJ/VasE family protein